VSVPRKDLEVCAPAGIVNTLVREVAGYFSNVARLDENPQQLFAVLFAIAVRLERIATALEVQQ